MKLKALSTILAAIQGKQTPKSNSKINTKIDEFEENPYQRELRFDAVDHPAEYSWLQCRDYPDWKDGDGDTCEVMAEIIPKDNLTDFLQEPYDDEYYTDEFDYCSFFGGYYDDENTAGLTANEACCACGGGIPEYELCNNFQTPEGNYWTDATGRNCDAYAQFHLCYEDGDSYAKWGMTADQACCACRGGAIGTCQDYEDFTDHVNKDCSWYNANYNDEIDANTRCYVFGDEEGTYAGGTVTPNEACCVCGGGVSTLDYPSFAPASETLTASSSSSSSVSSSSSWSEVTLKPDSSSFQIHSSSFYVTNLLTGLTISLILGLSIQF